MKLQVTRKKVSSCDTQDSSNSNGRKKADLEVEGKEEHIKEEKHEEHNNGY